MSPRKKSGSTAIELTPEALRAMVNKKYGEGTVKLASDPSLVVERIPTGILSLDHHLGGFPRNRYVELYGSASVGKTATALKAIANAQKLGMRCAFMDVERTFDPEFAEALGVDVENLEYAEQREHGNRVIDLLEIWLRSGLFDIIAMDSIAALLPKAEQESDMDAGSYGMEQAKLMSKALRKLTAANRKTCMVFINQTRDSVGGVFVKKATTSGGRAMGFYAGVRIEMVKTETLKRTRKIIDPAKGDEKTAQVAVAHRVLVRIEKNKVGGAKPMSQTTFVFNYDKHDIDHMEDVLYVGRQIGLIHKSGKGASEKWWVEDYEDEKQSGRVRFKKWLRRNQAVLEELEESIQEMLGEEPDPVEEEE